MATETEKSLIKEIMGRHRAPGGSPSTSSPDTPDYRKMVRDTATRVGVDPDLFDALVRRESDYNYKAISPKGAIGLTQLLPDTARELGVDPYDPEDNARGGAAYLKMLIDRYEGDTTKALAAYNFGMGRVDKGVPWPKETQDYVRAIQGGRGYSAPAPPPAVQADYGPQQGVPEWVPSANQAGRQMSPLARRLISRLGPPQAGPVVESRPLLSGQGPSPEASAVEPVSETAPTPTPTIGQRIMSAAVSLGGKYGLASLPIQMLKSIGIASKHIDAMFGRHKELDEYATSYIAKQLEDVADFWFPEDKILKGEFLSNMLPAALGQGVGFLFGGALTESAYAFPAITGAAISGVQGYEEAKAAGAPEDKQLLAYLLNLPIGMTEAIPIGNLLNRLDRGTGGTFKRALIESGKNTLEEAVQEAILQQVPQNIVAKWVYDNQRSIMDLFFISGGVGGAAGAVQGFLTTLITGALGARTHHLSNLDPKERHEIIEEETRPETPKPPGQVPPQSPSGGSAVPEPTQFPEEVAPEPVLSSTASPETPGPVEGETQNDFLRRYHEILKRRRELVQRRLAGFPEEEVAPTPEVPGQMPEVPPPPEGPPAPPPKPFVPPPIPGGFPRPGPPVIGFTTEAMEEARKWTPWISEGEIQSSSDLPALIEVARNRMKAYKEKVLTDQATTEEFKLLNTPGAPKELIFKMIEERLSQEPPPWRPRPWPERPGETPEVTGVTGAEELGPVPSLPPVVAPSRVEGEIAPTPAPVPVPPVTQVEEQDEEERQASDTIRKYIGQKPAAPTTGVPRETLPQVTPEVTPQVLTPEELRAKREELTRTGKASQAAFERMRNSSDPGLRKLALDWMDMSNRLQGDKELVKKLYQDPAFRKAYDAVLNAVTVPAKAKAMRQFFRELAGHEARLGGAPEAAAPAPAAKTTAPWVGQEDPDYAIEKTVPATDFKVGERFTGPDGRDYTVVAKSKLGVTVQGQEGNQHVLPRDTQVPYADRFMPGHGGTATAEVTSPDDVYASAPQELRTALTTKANKLYNRGIQSREDFREAMLKEFGEGVGQYIEGTYNKLAKKKGLTDVGTRQAPGPPVPPGEEKGGGVRAPKVPQRAGPEKPAGGPEGAAGPKAAKKGPKSGEEAKGPEVAKGPERPPEPVFTREVREGGVATLSRELLPKLPDGEVERQFPKATLEFIAKKLKKVPMAHQIENAVRALRAFALEHSFLIADGTGTGKTLSAGLIIYKLFSRNPNAKVLIVVKNEDLAAQWKADVADMMGWKTSLYSRFTPFKEGHVNFITYKRMEMAWTEKRMPEIQKFAPDLLILDESQALKNWLPARADARDKKAIGSKTALSCEEASRMSKNVLFMSATPFESVLHTAYLTTTKLWHPKVQWRDWLQKELDLTFKDGYWTGLTPKKLAKFHKIMVSQGRMTKSEIDFSKITNSKGKKVTLTTENIKVPQTEDQKAEAARISRIFQELSEDPEIQRSPYKRRLVRSIRYLVFRAFDEESKLWRAIELAHQARARGETVVFTLFRKNDTDMEDWWRNVQQGKRAGGQGKGYGEKSFMPALIQHLAANGITIRSPVRVLQQAFPDFVPITGDEPSGGPVRMANLKKLMAGEVPGAILTMAAGGTGLSAHDKLGNFPRTQINVSSPDTAGTMVQVAGRTFRLGSESSAKMYWLFGDSPSEGKLAAKIAWRLREMGALVVGQEQNPTADEIEQFDFPEDPAKEAEEMAAAMAVGGQEPSNEPEPIEAVFMGRTPAFGKVPASEMWQPRQNIPGIAPGSSASRETIEGLGYALPQAPPEPEGPEAQALESKQLEIVAQRLLKEGKATDIYDARRQAMQSQTATADVAEDEEEFFKEMREAPRYGPTQGEIEERAKLLIEQGKAESLHTAIPMAEEELVPEMVAGKRELAREAILRAGGKEETFKKLYGYQVAKLAAMPEDERNRFAKTMVAAIEGRDLPPPTAADDSANYGFLPYFHRQPNPEGTITTLKSMRDMIRDLEKALTTRHAVGWFRPGKKSILAHFEIWRNIIRSRLYNDVEVYSHESGHRLDQLMFPQHPGLGLGSATAQEIRQFKAELLRIATQAKPGQSRTPEGFAEFVRFYLTNEEQARKVAPKFYPWFEETLKSRLPKVYDAFMGVRADWENMMNADPVAAIEMTIMSGAIKGERIPKDYYPAQLYEAVVDEMATVRNATNYAIDELGASKELPADMDPRILASTWVAWPDNVETAVKVGQYSWKEPGKKVGRALLDIFKPIGKNIKKYEAYVKAYEAINDLETRGWDPWEKYGIYESWARETIKRYQKKFEPVRREMVQFYSNIVDIWVDSNFMSKRLASKMRSKQGVFSPMWRVMIDQALEEFEAGGAPGKRFANLPKITFQRHGSRLETIPSIEAAYKMLMVTYKRAEENALPLALYKLAESVPSGGRDIAAKVPEPMMPIMVKPREVLSKLNLPKAVYDEIDPELLEKAIEIFRPSPFKPKAPYAYVWDKGEKVYVEWDPRIYKNLHFLGRHDIGLLDKVLSPFVDALRAGAITLSPTFHIRSAIKDPWDALLQSSNPLLHAAYWVPSLVSGLTHNVPIVGKYTGESYRRYKRAMGGVSTFLGIQPEDVAALAERDLAKRYDKLRYWSNPRNWAHELFGIMSHIGLALEYMPRIAEARVHGLMKANTRAEFLAAGFPGRNATVDFNMMGGFSRSVTRSAAFFGVGQAGIARMAREWKTRPLAAAVKFAIFGILPTLFYYMFVRRDPRWDKIPQKERDQSFIFWIPGLEEPRRIPKPHEWGVLMTLVERALQAHDAKDPSMLNQLAVNVVRNLPNPVPTGLMLAYELAANYSEHLGRPIAPTRGEPGERYWNYTSETAKGIGRLLGVSPPKVEYALRQLSGGLYTRVLPKVEEGLGLKEPSKTMTSGAQTPVIGALTYRYPTQSTEQINRFYDRYWVEASQVYESFTGKRKAEPEDLKRYIGKRSQMLAVYYALRPFQKTLASLRDARELITASTTMPEAEKRERLTKILNQMDAIATKANKVAESILGHKPKALPPATTSPGPP